MVTHLSEKSKLGKYFYPVYIKKREFYIEKLGIIYHSQIFAAIFNQIESDLNQMPIVVNPNTSD